MSVAVVTHWIPSDEGQPFLRRRRQRSISQRADIQRSRRGAPIICGPGSSETVTKLVGPIVGVREKFSLRLLTDETVVVMLMLGEGRARIAGSCVVIEGRTWVELGGDGSWP